MNTADRKAERDGYTTYVLDGVPYIPHYRNDSVYVGPGYGKHNFNRYTYTELMVKGAKPKEEALWIRGTKGIVNAKHP